MTYRMNPYDAEELLLTISGDIGSDLARRDPMAAADDACRRRYDCDLETFTKIAQDLLPLAMVARSGLSGEVYQGFAKGGCFIVKRPDVEEASE